MSNKFKITEEKLNRISERFNAVIAEHKGPEMCPLCGKSNFNFTPLIVQVPVQDVYPDLFGASSQVQHLACAPLACFTCGNTLLINLKVLGGLEDIINPSFKLEDL